MEFITYTIPIGQPQRTLWVLTDKTGCFRSRQARGHGIANDVCALGRGQMYLQLWVLSYRPSVAIRTSTNH